MPLGNGVSGAFLHLPTHDLNFVEHFIPNWHDTLGRRRRCRRAQIRRQIAKRHIGFMADSGNNRLFAHRNRADDALFIERPQILHRTAAARHNDDAHMFQPLKQMNGFNHLFIRADSLHAHRTKQNMRIRIPPQRHIQNIMNHCACWRGDHADRIRIRRQSPLSFRFKQSLASQLFFKHLQPLIEHADTLCAHPLDDELALSAPHVKRHASAGHGAHAFKRHGLQAVHIAGIHYA